MNPWIPEVKRVFDQVEKEFEIRLDSCLLNEYATGKQKIGAHSDREIKPPRNIVVTVSLGGPRDFYFKYKKEEKPDIKVVLESGDYILMEGKTQELFKHSIPARAKANYRVSLTGRILKD